MNDPTGAKTGGVERTARPRRDLVVDTLDHEVLLNGAQPAPP
jgi:hypothetical protein